MARDFLGREWDIDCMGCALADGTMLPPGGFVVEGQHFIVHQDPLIPLPGFLVIAARRHIRSITEMESAEYAEFAELLQTTTAAIKQAANPKYVTIIQEERSVHFHLWFFPWTDALIEKYGAPVLTPIRSIMADYQQETLDDAAWEALSGVLQQIKTLMG